MDARRHGRVPDGSRQEVPPPHLVASLRIRLGEGASAEAAKAIAPDDEGFAVTRAVGDGLVVEATGPATSVLRTLDDALACVRALGHP